MVKRIRRGKVILAALAVMFIATSCGGKMSASDYYKQGMKQYKAEKYEDASASLKEAVKKNPNKAEYYIDYGMTLIQCQNYEEALIQFDKAILDKDNKIVRENNKMAYRGKGIAYYCSADYEAAIKEFQNALNIADRSDLDVDLGFYLGDAQTKMLDQTGAIETYTKIIDRHPDQSDAYYKRAILEGQTGSLEDSIADFDKAISYEKENYEYYFGKYAILLEQGDNAGAQEVLTKALAIKTKSKEDYYNVAIIHFYQENYDTAKAEFAEAINNGFTGAYYYLGEIAMVEKDYETAASNYEQYIQTMGTQKSAMVYNQLGEAYLKLKSYDQALQAFEDGIALNDNSVMQPLKYNQIIALEYKSDFKNAYKKAKKYVKEYPEDEGMSKEVQFLKTRQKGALVDNTTK
ncbi:tetratricopeptide repeat protein [Anaerosporobacter faecicola]|uniref:tetratricopeptide repeat protein n=1 Tax=Anaerosporobacter faecicola TaxID=2718714 RepID=UPI00143C7E9A|nr:tetratricopeptide repeat protein [Anaerosporobacter faecicola]